MPSFREKFVKGVVLELLLITLENACSSIHNAESMTKHLENVKAVMLDIHSMKHPHVSNLPFKTSETLFVLSGTRTYA